MTVTKIQCDICGRVKGEANKWLRAVVYGSNALCGPGIYIGGGELGSEAMDICSDTCLQKKLGEVLAAIRSSDHTSLAPSPSGECAGPVGGGAA